MSFFSQGLFSGSGHFSPRQKNREQGGQSIPSLMKSDIPGEKDRTINRYVKPTRYVTCIHRYAHKKKAMRSLSPTSHKVPEQVQRLRLQFRNLLRLSAPVELGEAPEGFDFAPPLAVDHVARHPQVQAVAQLVQDALGQVGLGFIQHDPGTWQGDQGEA